MGIKKYLSFFNKNKGRLILISIILILIPIIGLLFFDIFLVKDELAPLDSDLQLLAVEIPKEENAFYDFDLAVEKIYWPEKREEEDLIFRIIKREEWDEKFAKNLIEENKEAFFYLDKAVNYQIFQFPEFQDPITYSLYTPLPNMGGWRNIAKLSIIKSFHLFREGKEKDSFDEALKIVKLGQLIKESPRLSLVQYLVGTAITEMGLDNIRSMIPKTNLSPKDLKTFQEELSRFKISGANREGYVTILKGGYLSFANTIDQTVELGKKDAILEEFTGTAPPLYLRLMAKSNYYYKPNQTKRFFAEYFRNEINKTNKDYSEDLPVFEDRFLMSYSLIEKLKTENLIGKAIYDVSAVDISGALIKEVEETFSMRATQLLIALKAYKIAQGKLPDSLIELIPEYVLEVPKSPFNEEPIRYSVEKKMIYINEEDLTETGSRIFKIEF